MHVVFREKSGLEETETPTDLGQDPAELAALSYSDSDLGALAAGWRQDDGLPTLRLANLATLTHPVSVDAYLETTLAGAKGVLVRLIGGAPYWSYGLERLSALARSTGMALAALPADGRPDPALDAASTLPVSTLRRLQHLCDAGGAAAGRAALAQLALAAGFPVAPAPGPKALPPIGYWTRAHGPGCKLTLEPRDKPLALLAFYRAYLAAADTAPIEALAEAFEARGFDVLGVFAPSLKAEGVSGWLARQVAHLDPALIVNATAFSARGECGASPLDASRAPVFQVALATNDRAAWDEAERGLSPADLAMHVALPEVDGRIFLGAVSFKAPEPRDPDLQFSRMVHRPEPERIDAAADRATGWERLAATQAADRRVALVLSTYPGKDWNRAHAVGLDALASAEAILEDLKGAGYAIGAADTPLQDALGAPALSWPVCDYLGALDALPAKLRDEALKILGAPEDDPAVNDGAFHFHAVRRGSALVALQPERGGTRDRDAEYHDLSRTPRHGYIAFYLWLRAQADALVHVGAHGTLEWLPGKSVALSGDCWPEALTGALPVIYPFIVNDPGEAAQAKRRIGAVTLGHIPPPLKQGGAPQRFARLEALLDEFSNADGLDPRRRDRLQRDIRDEARALGVEDDLGLGEAACPAEAVTRIDRFVCDVKDSQFGDGLHVWGRTPQAGTSFDPAPSVQAERAALLEALAGKRIDAGPSGSPYRGRSDVLPTGRNLYAVDPRSVPSRAAHAQGVKLAEELMRRHLQDHGDWPRGLVVDLWGSATMRTAGEEFAMALHLLGAKPVWDAGSERVSGVEILPIAELERPRLDVTLRVSGLFRDVFPGLSALFAQAVRMLAARDEAPDWNPFAGRDAGARVYGPAPGGYGLGMGAALDQYGEDARRAAGEAWLAASGWALDGARAEADAQGVRARVKGADAFVHLQDLPETDLLLASDYAAHEAGFAAAQAATGGEAALYHLDATDPDRPRARALPEEIARVVRARATNPAWLAGMRRHGFRGAAEIAATLEHMAAFAHLAQAVTAHLFDLYFEATLGDDQTVAFMERENPEALQAMRDRFAALREAGLWTSRSNSVIAGLAPNGPGRPAPDRACPAPRAGALATSYAPQSESGASEIKRTHSTVAQRPPQGRRGPDRTAERGS